MPFKNDKQRKACYAKQSRGEAGSWDCDKWQRETEKKHESYLKTFKQFVEVKDSDNVLQQQSIQLAKMKQQAEQMGDTRLVQQINKAIAGVKQTWQDTDPSQITQIINMLKNKLHDYYSEDR